MPPAYNGSKRKLVLSIDLGTTYSGISYAILDPGQVPETKPVLRCAETPLSDKIALLTPHTVILDCRATSLTSGFLASSAMDSTAPCAHVVQRPRRWNANSTPISSISATTVQTMESLCSLGGACLPALSQCAYSHSLCHRAPSPACRRFKLHLRPDGLDATDAIKRDLPPLPAGKTVVHVFADFLGYLFTCARKYIKESAMNGETVWSRIENEIEFVLAHPNGWEGPQQGRMREAAVLAGLVPNTDAGQERIHFVTEGEASIHYCIQNGLLSDEDDVRVHSSVVLDTSSTPFRLQDVGSGGGVMVVDAGGGTVDLSSYVFTSTSPLKAREVATPGCE